MYGLVRGTDSRLEPHFRVGSLESGTLLCQAYEAYLELHTPASISFEHGWFLLRASGLRHASLDSAVRSRIFATVRTRRYITKQVGISRIDEERTRSSV